MSNKVVKPEVPQTTWLSRVACWIIRVTRTQAHARALHPCSHTHGRTRARAHKHTHTHTQKNVILIAFTRQQRCLERASMLRYTYIACLVILTKANNKGRIYSFQFYYF